MLPSAAKKWVRSVIQTFGMSLNEGMFGIVSDGSCAL
jgi:hypothetical protein